MDCNWTKVLAKQSPKRKCVKIYMGIGYKPNIYIDTLTVQCKVGENIIVTAKCEMILGTL